jgi:hypothetical protein
VRLALLRGAASAEARRAKQRVGLSDSHNCHFFEKNSKFKEGRLYQYPK